MKTHERKRHLAAVMFTDLVGYTALMGADESAARAARESHRGALTRALPDHRGRLLQYFGDGGLSLFDSAIEAVRAAVEIQRQMRRTAPRIQMRIGIHSGDITYDEQGAFGNAVNVAARLESLATPGAILISDKVFDEIRNQPDLSAVSVGTATLKHVAQLFRVYAVTNEGLTVPTSINGAGRIVSSLLRGVEQFPHSEDGAERTNTDPGRLPEVLPLVGRSELLARLSQVMEDVQSGSGRTVFFVGDLGVGKSRLVGAIAQQANQRNWLLARGKACRAEQAMPFAPFAEAFLPLLQRLDLVTIDSLMGGQKADFAYFFPALGRGGPGGALETEEHGHPRSHHFWSFAELLRGLSRQQPLVVILEDLEWADQNTLELLHFIARHTADAPILTLCPVGPLTRPGSGHLRQIVNSIESLGAITVRVDPLTKKETVELVARTFGESAEQVSGFAEGLYERTDGNPWFIECILRDRVENGTLRFEEGHWMGWEDSGTELPWAVRDKLSCRLLTLSSESRQVAELAAVIGDRIDFDVLRQLSGRTDAELAESLAQLHQHLVLRESGTSEVISFQFVHPLLREVLMNDLGRARTLMLQQALAKAISEMPGPVAPSVAEENRGPLALVQDGR